MPHQSTFQNDRGKWGNCENNTPSPNLGEGRGEVKKAAFTLAEVLITLGIIGVVAAMTMPALVAKYKERETVVKLKKVYTILQQAQMSIIQEYGTFENLITTNTATGEVDDDGKNILDYTSTNYIKSLFAKNLKVASQCEPGNNCLGKPVNYLSGTERGTYKDPALILADGTKLFFGWAYTSCSKSSRCIEIGVALPGGDKNHYTLGRDIFYFIAYSDRILPKGDTKGTLASPSISNDACKRDKSGANCASWIIFNENMDYLHCDDLSWDGKKKCK